MFGSSPFAGSSPHRDILEAPIPVDSVSRLVLLQELKNRGKAAVQAAQYPDAILLYQKALEVTNDNKEKSILEANLSLCHQKMNYYEAAVETGKRATAHDAMYVKGWWRLGQAFAGQKRYMEAVQAMQEAIKLEPGNKALQKERDKFQSLKSSGGPPPETNTTTKSTTTKASKTTTTSTSSVTTTTTSSASTAKTSSSKTTADDDEEFSASDIVRGYKVVNGKKTSYFHNELSQDVAKLIGDIAPQKLDATAAAAASTSGEPSSDSTNKIGSAWNKAGTWEEKDISSWAKDSLQSRVGRCEYSWQNFRASVNKCDLKGHASVAMVRGKKRYIYEMDMQVEWQVTARSDESIIVASGKLSFPEIDGTCSGVYEADVSVSTCKDPLLPRADLDVHVCKHGLRDEIHAAINGWIELLKETY